MDYTTAITVLSQALILNIIPVKTFRILVDTIKDPPMPIQVELLRDLQREIEHTQFEEMMMQKGRKIHEIGIIHSHETKSIN